MKEVIYEEVPIIFTGEEYCREDYLSPMIPLLKKLGFSYVRSHGRKCEYYSTAGTLTAKRPTNNAIFMNDDTARPRELTLKNWIVIPTIPEMSTESGAFHRHFGIHDEGADMTSLDVTHLNFLYKINDHMYIHIGYYDATKNIVYGCDLTHNRFGCIILETMLNHILDFNSRNNIKREFVGLRKTEEERKPEMPKNFMLGLDPEFLLFDQFDDLFSAHLLLGPDRESKIGTDGTQRGYREIGELRPEPGKPEEIFNNLKRLLYVLDGIIYIKNKKLRVFSGGGASREFSLGGHIHFNMPYNVNLTTMLDDFIGIPLQNMGGGDRVQRRDYGRLSDIKVKPWGFEYRTAPSFIGKPDLFEGVMAVAYCIGKTWIDIVNTNGIFKYDDTPSFDDYRNLKCYDKYASKIDEFLSYIENKKSIEECDVLAAWGISAPIKTEVKSSTDLAPEEGPVIDPTEGITMDRAWRAPSPGTPRNSLRDLMNRSVRISEPRYIYANGDHYYERCNIDEE